MNRRLGALACVVLVCWAGACGGEAGDESQVSEGAVRECLAGAQIKPRAPGAGTDEWTGYAPIFVPDFTAYSADGTPVAIIVQGSEQRANRTAAHLRGAVASLGWAPGTAEVIARQNAVAVFARRPSSEVRSAVRSCLAG